MPDDSATPPYGASPAARITLDLPADVARALEAWIATRRERPFREDAAVTALREFLTAMGCMPFAEEPEGRAGWH